MYLHMKGERLSNSKLISSHSSILKKRIGWLELSIIFVYALLLLIGLSWARSMGSVAFASTLLILAIASVSSSEVCCRLLFVCFPFFNLMGSNLGGTSMFYVIVFLFAVKSLLDGSAGSASKRLLIYVAIILATLYNFTAGSTYLRWLIHILVPLLLVATDRTKRHFPTYIKLLTASLVISSIIGQMMVDSGVYIYNQGSVWVNSDVTTARFAGLVGDAVFYGQLISVVIGTNVYLALSGHGYKLLIPMCLALAFFAFLTYSKSALVSLAVVAVFLIFGFIRRLFKDNVPVHYVLFVITALFVFYWGLTYLLSGSTAFSLDALTTRLGSNDLLTGRNQIWQAYIGMWNRIGLPMFFKGIGFDVYSSTMVYENLHHCHNIYIESITLFGVIGTAILITALIRFISFELHRGATASSLLPCVVLLVSGLILHGFTDYPFFYVWTVALCCIEYSASQRTDTCL